MIESLLHVLVGVVLLITFLKLSKATVLGGGAALVVILLVLKRAEYGLYCAAATIPLGMAGPIDSLHGTLTITRLIFYLTAASFILRCAVRRKVEGIPREKKNSVLLILALVILLSAFTGLNFAESVTGIFHYYSCFLMYIMVILLVRDEITYNRTLLFVVCPLTLALILGILSYNLNLGFAARFSVSEARRLTSTEFLGPNSFALLIVSIFPFAVNSYIHEREKSKRFLYLLWAGLLFYGTLLTYSRASTVTLIIVSLIILARSFDRLSRREIAGFAVAGILILLLLPGLVFQRVESLSRGEDDPSLRSRLSYLKVGYEIFKDHPLLGVGPNNYRVAYASPQYKSAGYLSESNLEVGRERGRVGRAAHNMYAESLSELGIVGFALLLYLFYLGWKDVRAAEQLFRKANDEKSYRLTSSLELGFLAFLLNSFFLSSGFFPILWIFLGLSSASLAIARGR
ncbi:MAG: O-antigen ligase family protein [Candidatus Glassbacteria bacterium]